jgi:hypothetical protein
MTTIIIDILDNRADEVNSLSKKSNVKIRQSDLAKLNTLTKEDYQKYYSNQSKTTRNKALKYL